MKTPCSHPTNEKEAAPSRRFLDTLAQTGTAGSDNSGQYSGRMVYGPGADLTDKKTLKGRARRKLTTQRLVIGLAGAAEKKGEPERTKTYWNAYHCQDRVLSAGGRVHGTYCKTRFCTVCCAIRKAEIINRYMPVISTWDDPYFVTLTVKSVPAHLLKRLLRGIQKRFGKILDAAKKRHQRKKGEKFMGVKSLECNFNPLTKTYNPHLHLIVPNAQIADTLIREWLARWPPKYANLMAQHKRKVQDLQRDMVETIKYGSKIFTEPDMVKKGPKKIPPIVYAAALDTIFDALKDYRLFDRFGFNLPKSAARAKLPPTLVQECEEWHFSQSQNDWLNEETGELMSGFIPPFQLLYLLNDYIDTDLQ